MLTAITQQELYDYRYCAAITVMRFCELQEKAMDNAHAYWELMKRAKADGLTHTATGMLYNFEMELRLALSAHSRLRNAQRILRQVNKL